MSPGWRTAARPAPDSGPTAHRHRAAVRAAGRERPASATPTRACGGAAARAARRAGASCRRRGARSTPARVSSPSARRDRRPVGADEVGEPLVAERQRDDDARRRHPPPALGEVPEREQQPVVDALVVGDRERDREVVGAPRAAVEELDAERRPRHDALRRARGRARRASSPRARVQPTSACTCEPSASHDHGRSTSPWPSSSHAAPAQHVDLARHQPVDDQEAAVVGVALERGRRVPDARRQPRHARERLAARALVVALVEQLAELGIGVDERDGLVAHTRESYPIAMSARVRRRADARQWSNLGSRPTVARETSHRPRETMIADRPPTAATQRAVTAVQSAPGDARDDGRRRRARSPSSASSTCETAPQLTEEVELAVWSTVGAFVLDLSGVTFLDSSGLHALLRARAYLAARGPVARAGVPGRAGAPRARPRERARHVRGLPDGRGRRGRTGSGRRIKSPPGGHERQGGGDHRCVVGDRRGDRARARRAGRRSRWGAPRRPHRGARRASRTRSAATPSPSRSTSPTRRRRATSWRTRPSASAASTRSSTTPA